jgi:hypothetical protein
MKATVLPPNVRLVNYEKGHNCNCKTRTEILYLRCFVDRLLKSVGQLDKLKQV